MAMPDLLRIGHARYLED